MSAAAVIPEFLDSYTRCQPELIRDRWHRYKLGDEPVRPSITTVTGKMSKGDGLLYWSAGCAADYVVGLAAQVKEDPKQAPVVLEKLSDWSTIRGQFNERRGEKQDVGSQFHLVSEWYAAGKHIDKSVLLPEVLPRANMLEAFYRELRPRIIATEFPVLNDTFWYAGALDLLTVMDIRDGLGDCLWCIDYKTSESAFEPREGKQTFYPIEYWLQLMAAVKAEWIYDTERGRKIPMPKIQRIGSINVREDKISLWEWPIMAEAFHAFTGLLMVERLTKMKIDPSRRVDVLGGKK